MITGICNNICYLSHFYCIIKEFFVKYYKTFPEIGSPENFILKENPFSIIAYKRIFSRIFVQYLPYFSIFFENYQYFYKKSQRNILIIYQKGFNIYIRVYFEEFYGFGTE